MAEIAFIGAGRMATAMVLGLIQQAGVAPEELVCLGADDGTAQRLQERTGIHIAPSYEELLREAKTVVLAIKPQQLASLSNEVSANIDGKLVISILAGTPLARLRQAFPGAANIVRAMPNTPGQIAAGITAYAPLTALKSEEQETVEKVLGALGMVLPQEESALDAVTAVSGSGPAYVFEFVAALRDGGVTAGLPRETAQQLALETVYGAARLLKESGEEPESLRDAVTSPGGTTLAGLQVMEQQGFRKLMTATIEAARKRSEELSQ